MTSSVREKLLASGAIKAAPKKTGVVVDKRALEARRHEVLGRKVKKAVAILEKRIVA